MVDNPFSLAGKNIIITGASSGIGRESAVTCSKMGANIILIGRNREKLNDTFSQLCDGKHEIYCQDITDFQMIEGIIADSISKLGKIDGFIHSAGIEITLPISNLKPNDYSDIFSINFISAMEFIKHLSKKKNYRNESGASYVLIASVMGIVGNSGLSAYSASKGAVLSSVKSLAIELASKNIRINSISPGIIETEMVQALNEIMSPELFESLKSKYFLGFGKTSDVANACVYLLSNASRWVTGSNLIIDGGYSAV